MADSDNQIDYDYTEMNMCFNEKHSTPFASDKNMDQMQEMVRHSNPKAVTDVAVGWDGLSKALISIQRDFDKEVARIQEHWKGTAADRFAEKAKRVSKSLGDCAKYASHTSTAMQNAGSVLGRIKDEVLAMEKPSGLSSALNSLGDGFTRSDEGMKRDLASGKGAQATLDANHDDLSAGREAQLAMAAKMETLGAAYNSQARAMGSWNRKPQVREDEDYPGDPGGYPPTPVAMPTSRTPQSPRSVSPGTARPAQTGTISPSKPVAPPSGVTGGAHKPPVPTHNVGTAIDGISGGRPGTPPTGGGGPVSTGSAGPGGAVASPGLVAGAPGGVPGTARGGSAGRVGGGMASGARAGGTAGGAAGAARGGVVGRPGAGGVGGAAGAGAGGKGGAARAGGMARQSGGVVGGTPRAGAGAGRGTAGGAGLHSSRGAAGRGASAVHRGGIAGAPGARTGRPKDQEQREGERPDYLVEDEETWTPQRNVAPRVIEE